MDTLLTLSSAREKREAQVEAFAGLGEAYAAWTVTTAKYPTTYDGMIGNSSLSAGLLYVVLGLGSEVGELAGLFDGDAYTDAVRAQRYADAWAELGDVQWYIARTFAELPALGSFKDVVRGVYDGIARNPPDESRKSGFDLQSALCKQAGLAQGVVKKLMRDGHTWSEDKRAQKIAELRDALASMVEVSVDFAEFTGPLVGCDGGYAALLGANRAKLDSRNERGAILGDGDHR